MKRVTVLGSSGSVGMQALDIIYKMRESICVEGLAVGSNINILKSQISKFKPSAVSVNSFTDSKILQKWCILNSIKVDIYNGDIGLEKLVVMSKVDMVIIAIVGSIGLRSTIAAIKAGKNIAIANKEVLVMAGNYIMKLAAENNVLILPIDSEHSAILQCCMGEKKSKIRRVILTASGGPLYKYNKDFSKITVSMALEHPTWKMGKKITVDSATLMNKGLEIIEVAVLFGIPIDKVEVVIHPQSIVHSMVEFVDGSVIAQLSSPDMRLPIQYALTYPERLSSNIKPLNLAEIGRLEFYKPNFNKFPCLNLAYFVGKKGYTMPAVMNAANEMAVSAFLNGEIKFMDIIRIVEKTVNAHKISKSESLDVFVAADYWARQYVKKLINKGI
jgi:1-deoxy-D-xylulose-5-phosphate reductoisomerase